MTKKRVSRSMKCRALANQDDTAGTKACDEEITTVPQDTPDEAFARQILRAIVKNGNTGLSHEEIAVMLGASVEDVADMCERLREAGYIGEPQRRKVV